MLIFTAKDQEQKLNKLFQIFIYKKSNDVFLSLVQL